MTTAPPEADIQTSTPPPKVDIFRYGWRYIRRVQPDGTAEYEQVPLTLEDVLYPEVGDFVVHSKAHEDTCTYLADVFNARLRDDPTAVVLHDVRIAWDVPGLRPNGPDIAVICGVAEQRNWSTFDVAEENAHPALIVEVTSPETRQNDLLDKVDIYEQAGIPLYVIVDTRPWKGEERAHLLVYHLTLNGYEILAPDERGWLWLEAVRVWLGVRENRVECYDADGSVIGDYKAIDQARAAAEARAETAEARAETAEAQVAAEAQARMQAEARLRELEDQLRQVRGENPQ
jgi:Uma2 family endonuclease